MPVYPQPNLNPNAAPWGKSVNDRLTYLENLLNRKSLDDLNANKQQNSSAELLSNQVAALAVTAAAASDAAAQAGTAAAQANSAVDRLNGIAQSWYNENVTLVQTTGFSTSGNRPSVVANSPTGRIEVTFGGSANNGEAYFVFSVSRVDDGTVLVDRGSMQQNPARRIAIIGGASFAPSGYRTQIATVPANTPVLVRVEYFGGSGGAAFLGGSILVKVSP